MLEKSIRYVAVIASAVVVLSFGLFAIDETREASATTRAEIAAADAAKDPGRRAVAEQQARRSHNVVRRTIDDANEVIVTPFATVADQHASVWVRRTVPAALALLCFGVGLGFLARYAHARSH